MKPFKKSFCTSTGFLSAFVLWTAIVRYVDVQSVGPQNTQVGLAKLNLFIHRLTGVHFSLYNITDWLGLVPIGVCMGFGMLGICQWMKQKRIQSVDFSILILGGFYILTAAVYLFFESFVINYRPVLINGYLEASYPSSTTILVLCVMPMAGIELRKRIRNRTLRIAVIALITAFAAFMVIGRLLSGVHWFSDIVGGALLSAGLVGMYAAICRLKRN